VRVLMELLRSDPSNMIGPFRLNLVVAVLVLLTGALILIVADRRRPQRL
jgi:prolipoprotein diacylglyceryltransferase